MATNKSYKFTADEYKDANNGAKWYVVTCYSGQEKTVKNYIEQRTETMPELQESVKEVLIAEETEVDYKNGKKVEKVVNMNPGNIYVHMVLESKAWYAIRNTPGVTGILGSSGHGKLPTAVPEEEMENILRMLGKSDKKLVVDFKVGDRVRIVSGAFANVEGTIESMNDESETAVVLTIMFGHETPTEISYDNLTKNLEQD